MNADRPDADTSLAQRLERGELLYYPVCPFALPSEDDCAFLLGQQLGRLAHKNISFNPTTGKASGFVWLSSEQALRLERILGEFSHSVTEWLAQTLPEYPPDWRLDRASFRPLEEATRVLRLHARNDLLHIDTFPTRPSKGDRLLRVFVNLNPSEPRVWATSDSFARLLDRYGEEIGLPEASKWTNRMMRSVPHLLRTRRSPYDDFMLRMHHFLKASEPFQERSAKRLWSFAPGSAWVAMTDGFSHAVLRGRFALEHSYFVAPDTLCLPGLAPAAQLAQAIARARFARAA